MMTAQLAMEGTPPREEANGGGIRGLRFLSSSSGGKGGGSARGSRRVSDFGTEMMLSGRRLGSEVPFAARLERQRELARGATPSKLALAVLHQALQSLLRMDVVGLTEDMPGFERALRTRWPDTFGQAGSCTIPSGTAARNPTAQHTVRGNASTVLDEATREAILSLNVLDSRLYDLAKTVSARQAECVARVAKLDASGGQRGREARGCFAAVRMKLQNRRGSS